LSGISLTASDTALRYNKIYWETNALAQSLLKMGTNQLDGLPFSLSNAWAIALRALTVWPFLLGFACYAVSLVVWIAALSRLPLVGLMRTFVADGALVALSLIVGLALLVNLRPTPGGPVYEALGTVGTYILPALGIAVALTTLRRRRALALAGASFVLTFVGLLWLGRSE
jgi:hypothetical protein